LLNSVPALASFGRWIEGCLVERYWAMGGPEQKIVKIYQTLAFQQQACTIRDRQAERDDDNANLPKYNIRTFLRALVQSGYFAKLFINALKDEAVHEALLP
jgi:hypothetical protein